MGTAHDEIMKLKIEHTKIMRRRIENIGLPDDISSILRWDGDIKTVKKLLETDVADLLKIYGIGEKKVEIIKEKIEELGFSMIDSRAPKSDHKRMIPVRSIDFPYNLFSYITETRTDFSVPAEVTQDIMEGIYFAFLTLDRDSQVIMSLRFEMHQTLNEISHIFSVSSTQIENKIKNALTFLFQSKNIRFIEKGLHTYINEQIADRARILTDNAVTHAYQKGYESGYNDAKEGTPSSSTEKSDILCMPVEKLNLSIRSYNCIKRAGIDTVADVISRSEEEMISVRNLGRASLNEIIEKLSDLGLSLRSEKEIKMPSLILRRITFTENNPVWNYRNTTEISANDNRMILATRRIRDGSEQSCCSYEISSNTWAQFVDEAVIRNGVISWSQEEFASYDISDRIIEDDTAYTVEFLVGETFFEFSGGTASKGIRLILNLFSKYFEVPAGVEYVTEKVVDDIDW